MASDVGFTNIELNKADVARAKAVLIGVENGFPKAFSRALNKSATGLKTDMVDLTREHYNYKATHVRKRIDVNRATYTRLTASVKSVGPGTHLTDILGTRKTNKGMSVDVKKSTGRKLILTAFKAKGRTSGKEIVFRRVKENNKRVGRYPIEALYAPHPETVYNTPENWKRLSAQASKRLDDNLSHEVDVVLKGIA